MSRTIQEVAAAVELTLLRRGFVHEDPEAYRAGVRATVAAMRSAWEAALDEAPVDARPVSQGRRVA